MAITRSPEGQFSRSEDGLAAILQAELRSLREVTDVRLEAQDQSINSLREVMDYRFDALDRAMSSLLKSIDRRMSDLRESINRRFGMLMWGIGIFSAGGLSLLGLILWELITC